MRYLQSIAEKYPPFKTKEEERKMIESHLKRNDLDGLRDELVLRNVGLVSTIGKSWSDFYDPDELASYGIEGLTRAASSFDYKCGTKFSTYAAFAIRSYLRNHKKDKRNHVDERCVSLDKMLEDDEGRTRVADFLEERIPEECRTVKSGVKRMASDEAVKMCKRVIGRSAGSKRDFDIFCEIVLGGETHSDVAKRHGISRERARQVVDSVRRKVWSFVYSDEGARFFGVSKPRCGDFAKRYTVEKTRFIGGRYVTSKEEYRSASYDMLAYADAIDSYRDKVISNFREMLVA